MKKPGNGLRNLYSRRWFIIVGPIESRSFPGILIHSPYLTFPAVHEPKL
jgi:hypothetical protein